MTVGDERGVTDGSMPCISRYLPPNMGDFTGTFPHTSLSLPLAHTQSHLEGLQKLQSSKLLQNRGSVILEVKPVYNSH